MRIYDDTIYVEYGQVYIQAGAHDFAFTEAFAGQSNGLCGAAVAGELCLVTASRDGNLRFVVESLEEEPALDPAYQDAVEVSFTPLATRAALVGLMGGPGGCEFELTQPSYRVRYSVRNADAALRSQAESESEEDYAHHPDEYLVQLWPATAGPDRVVFGVNTWARSRHKEVDGTAEQRRAKAAADPNPLRDSDTRTRHAALVWLVQEAGASTGIAEDPLFIGAIEDSWDVLAEFEASGREPGDRFFVTPGLPSYRRAMDAVLPALGRWELGDRHKVRGKDFRSHPLWHRYQAWLAINGLLQAPFYAWDYPSQGAQSTVGHAQAALQERWPAVEETFVALLRTPPP